MMQLKQARNRTGMTQRDVSEKTGIPLGTLRRWEQGVNDPDTDNLVRLADLYGVSTDEILGSRYAPKEAPTDLSPDERELLSLYRSTNQQGRVSIMAVARASQGVEGQSASDIAIA